jgi:SAM-dependent methyltransferase
MNLNVPDIVATVEAKFAAEGLVNKFFKLRPCSLSDSSLSLTTDNCLLLEFATPQEEFPDTYQSAVYRMLVIFGLHQETEFAHALQHAIGRLRYRDNIDRIILWSTVTIDQTIIQLLKDLRVDVIFAEMPNASEILKTKSVHHFIPIENSDLNYSLLINLLAEQLIKRLRKLFHLVLSEIAAPIFNQSYGKAKIATREFMEFESDKLNRLIKKLKQAGRTGIAIDVGCGTGRHSFAMARHFETVFAYDFSPNMIDEANKIRRETDTRNILFLVNDFEYEKLIDEKRYYGQCDLVVASFGMGSFIEDTNSMLRRFYDWLRPGGSVFLSFYNANAITLNVTPTWRDSSLSAHVDPENNSLEVNLTPKTRFNVFCKLFDTGVEGPINRIFNIDTITTYPMMMALLPNNLLEDDFAHNAFVTADKTLADKEGQNGYYAIVIAHKTPQAPTGYINVERMLQAFQADYEMLEHEPVLSIEDVKREVGYFPRCMLKTILIGYRDRDELVAIVIQAEKRLDMTRIADLLQVNRYHIHFAREKEILQLGFPLGSVAPFGFETTVPIRKYIDSDIDQEPGSELDSELDSEPCPWFYTGTGDNRKTLKIRCSDFLRLMADYERIEV